MLALALWCWGRRAVIAARPRTWNLEDGAAGIERVQGEDRDDGASRARCGFAERRERCSSAVSNRRPAPFKISVSTRFAHGTVSFRNEASKACPDHSARRPHANSGCGTPARPRGSASRRRSAVRPRRFRTFCFQQTPSQTRREEGGLEQGDGSVSLPCALPHSPRATSDGDAQRGGRRRAAAAAS